MLMILVFCIRTGGGITQSWQRRYFILSVETYTFHYFEEKPVEVPLGEIPIQGSQIVTETGTGLGATPVLVDGMFSITPRHKDGRKYLMQAKNNVERVYHSSCHHQRCPSPHMLFSDRIHG